MRMRKGQEKGGQVRKEAVFFRNMGDPCDSRPGPGGLLEKKVPKASEVRWAVGRGSRWIRTKVMGKETKSSLERVHPRDLGVYLRGSASEEQPPGLLVQKRKGRVSLAERSKP